MNKLLLQKEINRALFVSEMRKSWYLNRDIRINRMVIFFVHFCLLEKKSLGSRCFKETGCYDWVRQCHYETSKEKNVNKIFILFVICDKSGFSTFKKLSTYRGSFHDDCNF